jgi:hypothetical protein
MRNDLTAERLSRLTRNAVLFLIATAMAAASADGVSLAAPQSPSPQATGFKTVDPQIVAKAKEWFARFQTGRLDRSQLDAQVNAELSDEVFEHEGAILRRYGAPSSFTFIRMYPIGGTVGYDFLLQFKDARIVEMIAFDPDGKLAGIDFATFVKSGS